jgi:hypothetical protein
MSRHAGDVTAHDSAKLRANELLGCSYQNEPQHVEQVPSTLHQQVRQLSLERANPTSSGDDEAGIPPGISALVQRLSEEAADPILPPDIILRISRISPTESFPKPRTDTIPPAATGEVRGIRFEYCKTRVGGVVYCIYCAVTGEVRGER